MAESDWTREEVEVIVADYLSMLRTALAGGRVNKAEHNRHLRKTLIRRTAGSVEYKHQNISAVLVEVGYDYLDGYRPRTNVQGLLREVVRERLAESAGIASVLARLADAPVLTPTDGRSRLPELVAPPKPSDRPRGWRETRERVPSPAAINFHERESRNRSLGTAGELMVVAFERDRLWRAGKRKLSEQVEHASADRGDGLGYDIVSYEESGRERLIEVKTTRYAEMTPFFLSRNELEVSKLRSDEYQLYRLYRFDARPKLFVLKGSLGEVCRLEPTSYRAEVA